jgi:hypothetical protein
MLAEVVLRAAADNKAYNTHNYQATASASTSTNFAANDLGLLEHYRC